ELVEHLDDVRLVEDGSVVGLMGEAERRIGLFLVDVVLLGLGRRGDEPLGAFRPHAQLERGHCRSAPFDGGDPFVLASARSWGTSRKLFVRPGPWMRSRKNGFSTVGLLTMNASAVVCRPRVGSYAITLM